MYTYVHVLSPWTLDLFIYAAIVQVHNSVECNYLGNAIALLCITFDGELPSNHFIKSTSKRIPTAQSKIDKSWHKQHIKE